MTTSSRYIDCGLVLLANGYRIIPIKPNSKRPGLDKWQELHATEGDVRRWGSEGFGGFGILTEDTPAIDLDIYDAGVSREMTRWCLDTFGDAPVRVGQDPKRLLLFCTEEPFTKLARTFVDKDGKSHKVEILGKGQQFVAFGRHPDTGRPFQWVTDIDPRNTHAAFLPTLTHADALRVLEHYGEVATAAGWTEKGSARTSAPVDADEPDNALLTLKPKLRLSMTEITEALSFVDQADEYDRWIMVGMALHHQSGGHPKALELWHEWSSTADNYDAAALDKRWKGFSEEAGTRTPVTFASVLKIANENRKEEESAEFERIKTRVRSASEADEITGTLAREAATIVEPGSVRFDVLVGMMQARLQELTGTKVRLDTVRKTIMSHVPRGELASKKAPEWCHGWVYLKISDAFYHVTSKTKVSEKGFNAMYDRLVLTEEDKALGNAVPSARAASLALNIYNIPTVDNTVYLPGHPSVLDVNGKTCVNTFDESSIPEARAPETDEEHAAIKAVEDHFNLLVPDELERTILLDFLAYNVQQPAEKIVWAVLLQGAEGAGKTILKNLMAGVLGPQNVAPVSAKVVMGLYTDWAEGKKMRFVEEVRQPGENRYVILETMKEPVANEEVTIRPMYSRSYEIPNVTNYVLYTNHWDALPVSKLNRRYFVLSTFFQTEEQVAQFNLDHPEYFPCVYDALTHYPEVLRWWFLQRELSPKFQPKRPALQTYSKTKMHEITSADETTDVLGDVLSESQDPEISGGLLNASKLRDVLESAGGVVPYGKAYNTLLARAGFHLVGRYRVDPSQPPARYYTRTPYLFPRGGELETIRRMIDLGNGRLLGQDEEVDPWA